MPRQRVVRTSFNAGEFSPRLYGRIDIEKYANGCKTLKNFLSMRQGGATRRPGFQYIAETKDSDEASKLIPFAFSTEQTYIIEAGDLYFRFYMNGGQIRTVDANTELLLHCDGGHQSTTFIDNGTTGHTVTANGTAKINQTQYKFGSASAHFTGATASNLSISDSHGVNDYWEMGSSEFAIDCWIRFETISSGSGTYGLWQQYDDTDNRVDFVYIYSSGGDDLLRFAIYDSSSPTVSFSGVFNAVADTWYHIALIRGWGGNVDDWAITVNGAAVATETDNSSWPDLAADFEIAKYTTVAGFPGYIDEFRISKGVARWTAAFSPPTTAYPYADGSGTIYELATTYTEAELANLKWVQSADVLFIVSPDRMPRKLTRTDHDAWAITDFTFDTDNWPPFLDINITAITMDASAVTGVGINLVASAAFFNSQHVGAYFAMHSGYMKITFVTDSTNAIATVIDDLTAHTATDTWYESSWSDYQGWPTAITFYEDRLCLSGTSGNPDRIELSQTGEYENFARGEVTGKSPVASDGLAITLSSRQINAVQWMGSTRRLLVGTSGAEWWIDGKDSSSAIDATELSRARNDSAYGSSSVAPVYVGNTVFFNQRLNKVVRAYSYDWETDLYHGRDMSIIAEHLTNFGNVIELAWQQTPHQIVWALRSDGVLLGLTYMREHKVEGWHRHELGGTDTAVESIATIEGAGEDELWAVVKRTINSTTKRYVERMSPLIQIDTGQGGSSDWTLEDAFFVDSGLTYRGAAVTNISGLNHLEGESVVALSDGTVVTSLTVSSGAITLPSAASVVHVGLNYQSDLEPLWPVVQDEQGIAIGVAQRIAQVNLMLYKSSGGKYGPDSSNLVSINYTEGEWDESSTYYSGKTAEMSIEDGYFGHHVPLIRQDEPLPLTVIAAIMEIEV